MTASRRKAVRRSIHPAFTATPFLRRRGRADCSSPRPARGDFAGLVVVGFALIGAGDRAATAHSDRQLSAAEETPTAGRRSRPRRRGEAQAALPPEVFFAGALGAGQVRQRPLVEPAHRLVGQEHRVDRRREDEDPLGADQRPGGAREERPCVSSAPADRRPTAE